MPLELLRLGREGRLERCRYALALLAELELTLADGLVVEVGGILVVGAGQAFAEIGDLARVGRRLPLPRTLAPVMATVSMTVTVRAGITPTVVLVAAVMLFAMIVAAVASPRLPAPAAIAVVAAHLVTHSKT